MAFLILVGSLFLGSCASKKQSLRPPALKKTERPAAVSGGTSSTGSQYIARYKDIAVAEMERHGIPASIKLAQALLESGNGNSYLARRANNHFGIKCGGSWKGKSVRHSDDRANECFRVYDNPEQSFRDHSQFLRGNRYKNLFALRRDDYKGWARGLKAAGYATNPRYPELLIDLIERYELYRYDKAGRSPAATASAKAKTQNNIPQKTAGKPENRSGTPSEPVDKTRPMLLVYEVKASDTLYAISQKHGISVERLKELNDLSGDAIAVGQLLIIRN